MRTEYDRIAKHNTEVVFINPDDLKTAQEFMAKSKLTRAQIPFPVVIDPERKFVKDYFVEKPTEKMTQVFPSTFLIDKSGTLRFKYIGMAPSDRPTIDHIEEILGIVEK